MSDLDFYFLLLSYKLKPQNFVTFGSTCTLQASPQCKFWKFKAFWNLLPIYCGWLHLLGSFFFKVVTSNEIAKLSTWESDDRGDQWNIGWWCLMTNEWAGGFCAGVTTVIYSCRSHQSEHFQWTSPSSHFNELGLYFNFASPQQRYFAEKVDPSSSIYQCYGPT